MKKLFCLIVMCLIFMPNVNAKRGCCSHHGGVAGCNSNGRTICNDGSLSPTCVCDSTPDYIYGCMDKKAKNYNKNANKSDGSCIYYVYGCTDRKAKNYNPKAEKNNGSCEYYIEGCTDKEAINYNSLAEKDNGSCQYNKIEPNNNQIINNNETQKDTDEQVPPINKDNQEKNQASYVEQQAKKVDEESEETNPIWVILGALVTGGYVCIKRKA